MTEEYLAEHEEESEVCPLCHEAHAPLAHLMPDGTQVIIGVDVASPEGDATSLVFRIESLIAPLIYKYVSARVVNNHYFILDDHIARDVSDPAEWITWMSMNLEKNVVAQTPVTERITVSTIFTGLNTHPFCQPPLLFETMIIDTNRGYQLAGRYSTYDEAAAGHQEVIDQIRLTEDVAISCVDCGAVNLEAWYTGQTWGETLCEKCFKKRERVKKAKERSNG